MSSKTQKRGVVERSAGVTESAEIVVQVELVDQNQHCWVTHESAKVSRIPLPLRNRETRQNQKIVCREKHFRDMPLVTKKKKQKSSATTVTSQSHDNPTFHGDNETESSWNPSHNSNREQLHLWDNTQEEIHVAESRVYNTSDAPEVKQSCLDVNLTKETPTDSTSVISDAGIQSKNTYRGSEFHQKAYENDGLKSPYQQGRVDNVCIVSSIQPRHSEENRLARPLSRSFSSASALTSDVVVKPGSNWTSAPRFYSMRVSPKYDQVKPITRSLLRDLSFSDTDVRKSKNYGSLRGCQSMPRRELATHPEEDEDSSEDISGQLKSQLESHLMVLMQELLCRGKIRQVAVLSQNNGAMIASQPPWKLTVQDQLGLVKAITITVQTMLRVTVEDKTYTVFKHGADKIMGRSGDSILVAQKTNSCVVVGVGDDKVPGSCLYEVTELVRALADKGW